MKFVTLEGADRMMKRSVICRTKNINFTRHLPVSALTSDLLGTTTCPAPSCFVGKRRKLSKVTSAVDMVVGSAVVLFRQVNDSITDKQQDETYVRRRINSHKLTLNSSLVS